MTPLNRWKVHYVGSWRHRDVCELVNKAISERYLVNFRTSPTRWLIETSDEEDALWAVLTSLPWGGPGGKAPERWFFVERSGTPETSPNS